jgi:HlyD family secretion protein
MKCCLAYIIIYLFIFLSSCSNRRSTVITYKLTHSDFTEKIVANGTTQAVNSLSIVAPRANVSTITVAHLVDEGTYVKKGDTICILSAPELVSMVESFTTSLESMEADMKKLEADNALEMSLLKAQIETNKAQVAISMLDSAQMKFAAPVKKHLLGLEQEKVNIEKKKLQKKFAAQMRINNAEIIQMKNRIMIQKSRIQMYQSQVNSLTIVAPQDGIVMHTESEIMWFMSNSGIGTLGGKIEERSSVWSGTPLLQLPDMSLMQISIELPEVDYKRVATGQKVNIQIGAVQNLFTTGIIKRKTVAGKTTQSESQVKTYEVIASIDSCHSRMKPGLSARCEILINDVKDTIVVPAAAIFGKDSAKIVYIADGESFRPVAIKTGISNSTESIISKGLRGNETISLMEPPYNMIIKQKDSKRIKVDTMNLIKSDSVNKE